MEKDESGVSEEDVEKEVKGVQEGEGEVVVKEEGGVENGDRVVVDFEGLVEGEGFEGGKGGKY